MNNNFHLEVTAVIDLEQLSYREDQCDMLTELYQIFVNNDTKSSKIPVLRWELPTLDMCQKYSVSTSKFLLGYQWNIFRLKLSKSSC